MCNPKEYEFETISGIKVSLIYRKNGRMDLIMDDRYCGQGGWFGPPLKEAFIKSPQLTLDVIGELLEEIVLLRCEEVPGENLAGVPMNEESNLQGRSKEVSELGNLSVNDLKEAEGRITSNKPNTKEIEKIVTTIEGVSMNKNSIKVIYGYVHKNDEVYYEGPGEYWFYNEAWRMKAPRDGRIIFGNIIIYKMADNIEGKKQGSKEAKKITLRELDRKGYILRDIKMNGCVGSYTDSPILFVGIGRYYWTGNVFLRHDSEGKCSIYVDLDLETDNDEDLRETTSLLELCKEDYYISQGLCHVVQNDEIIKLPREGLRSCNLFVYDDDSEMWYPASEVSYDIDESKVIYLKKRGK